MFACTTVRSIKHLWKHSLLLQGPMKKNARFTATLLQTQHENLIEFNFDYVIQLLSVDDSIEVFFLLVYG